ncbi:MAG: DUF4347 domain-containing protein [Cyanobacteria bacterium J007]|nr:MAG: DUF4347 domain-containing protein [Cyanobacteria bacterium J007]
MMKLCDRSSDLILIDPEVKDYHHLLRGKPLNVEAIALNPRGDGVEQLIRTLLVRPWLSRVHLISHGQPGGVTLCNTTLDLDAIARYARVLQQLRGSRLSLLLYGCRVAFGELGRHFVSTLGEVSGAAIAASTTPTGNATRGGDWQLQECFGQLDLTSVFDRATLQSYPGLLGNGPGGVGTGDGSSSLELWLKADAGVTETGGTVSSWQDQSGNGVGLTQGTTGRQPIYNLGVQNNRGTISFDGNNDYLETAFSAALNPEEFTLFFIGQTTGGSGSRRSIISSRSEFPLLPLANGGYSLYAEDSDRWLLETGRGVLPIVWNEISSSAPVVENNFTLISSHYSSDSLAHQLFINGTIEGSNSSAYIANTTQPLRVGAGRTEGTANDFFKGDISEIILYSESLNEAQRAIVENYLSAKYDTPLSAGDVYLGDTPENGNYDEDVAGIGRSASGTQESSSSAGLSIENSGFLQDNGDYLLFGHDRPESNGEVSADLPNGAIERWQRIWYLDRTDSNNNGGEISLKFDRSESGLSGAAEPGTYALLYRSGESGEFEVVATTTTLEDGDRAVFSGIDSTTIADGYYTVARLFEVNITAENNPSEPSVNGSFTVTLNETNSTPNPIAVNYTIAGTATPGADYQPLSGTVSIPVGADRGTISLQVLDDFEIDPAETVALTLAPGGAYIIGPDDAAELAITDDESPGIAIAPPGNSTAITEGGVTDTYTLVLTSQPIAEVTVNFSTDEQIEAIAPMTFTPSHWNTPQTVTVRAIDDGEIEGNQTSAIAHTVGSSDRHYNGLVVGEVTAHITDNDSAGLSVMQSGGNTTVAEGGSGDAYQVVLTARPTAETTVNTIADSRLSTTSQLVFTPENWNIPQAIDVTAIDDTIAQGNQILTISHSIASADPNYDGLATDSVMVDAIDNDSAGVSIVQIGGNTSLVEGESGDRYEVVLTAQPTAEVTIAIAPDNQTTVSATSLTFTPDNWNVAQSVSVEAIDDAIAEGLHLSTIAHSSSSADPNYDGLGIAAVGAEITDNDSPGVVLTPSEESLQVSEDGKHTEYSVSLTTIPQEEVRIVPTVASQLEAIAPLSFNPRNWNIPQTVTVRAIDDAQLEGVHSGAIAHQVESDDPKYNGLETSSLWVEIIDNEVAPAPAPAPPGNPGVAIVQPVGNTSVLEGFGSDRYKLVLRDRPTAEVTIAIATDGQTTIDRPTVVFTPDNWNIPQTIEVTAVEDDAIEGAHSSAIAHTVASSDPNYNGLSVPAAIVEVGDTDRSGKMLDLMSASATGLSEKDDRFWGSDADDLVHARSGNDLLFGRSGRDLLYGQSGNDGIDGGEGDDLLWGELGTDFIEGGGGDDVIYGGENSDRLHGGDGNDLLVGDGGNDHLFADAGVDTLTGGSGYDAFAIGLGTGGMSLETTNLIADFTVAEDRIDLIDNFSFDRLTIIAGTGDRTGSAIVRDAVTQEYLAIVAGVAAEQLTADAFI